MEFLAVRILWIKAQKWDRQDMCLLDWSRSLKLGTGVTTVDKVERQSEGSSQSGLLLPHRGLRASECPYVGEVSWAAALYWKSGDPETKGGDSGLEEWLEGRYREVSKVSTTELDNSLNLGDERNLSTRNI